MVDYQYITYTKVVLENQPIFIRFKPSSLNFKQITFQQLKTP